jgi:choline dehydrogenase-like flavoprotein
MTNSSGIVSADYIVVGGRIAGCALTARLREKLSFASMLLIEAGRDPSDDPEVHNAAGPIQFGTLI